MEDLPAALNPPNVSSISKQNDTSIARDGSDGMSAHQGEKVG